MKQRLLLLFLLWMASSFVLIAQEGSIQGQVFSKPEYLPLTGATVMLTDTVGKYSLGATTDPSGKFFIQQLPQGNYLLTISFIGYSRIEKNIRLSGKPLQLGIFYLTPENKDLAEVQVVGNAPLVNVKDDTTEYNADAYKVQPNAVAEDLVKKMPGLEVDNGTVKAQGEQVKRVYVDGKQFFGDDPSLALRNLPAELIDKVQLFEEMSEQARLTGFDDGDRSTSLNIVTRRNTRDGLMIKLKAGYGTEDRHTLGGNLLQMKNNRRLSLLGMGNNINEQNFSMQDLSGAGGGRSGGGMNPGGFSGRGPRGEGGSFAQGSQFTSGNGISTNNSAGINYSNEWKKIRFSGSYFFNATETQTEDLSMREYLQNLENTTSFLDSSFSKRNNYNHRANFRLEILPDSFNTVIWRTSTNYQNNDQNNQSERQTYQGIMDPTNLLNDAFLKTFTGREAWNFNTSILYSHSFRKKGRSFSLNTGVNGSQRPSSIFRNSLTSFYSDSSIQSDPSLQRVNSETGSMALTSSLTYTEPLGQKMQIMVNYYGRISNSNSDRKTWDVFDWLQTDSLNTGLSNTFDNRYTSHRSGVSLRYRRTYTNFTAGMNYQQANLLNHQIYPENSEVKKSFASFLPSLMIQYRQGRKSFQAYYNTYTQAPDVSQLQNVVDNSNPLDVSTGNPDLKEEYSHSFMMRYTGVQNSKISTFMMLVAGSLTSRKIAQSTLLLTRPDTIMGIPLGAGTSFSQPVNIADPAWNIRSFLTLGIPVTKLKFNVNLNTGIGYTGTPGYLNNQINTTRTMSLTEGITLASNISEKIDFTLSAGLSLNQANYSSNLQPKTVYYTQKYGARMHFILPLDFFLDGDLACLLNTGLSKGYNLNYTLLNASVGKYILKNRRLETRISVYDVLDQNNTINRNITQSYIEDTRSLSLRRYYMFSAIYNFRNFNAPEGSRERNRMNQPGEGHWMHDH